MANQLCRGYHVARDLGLIVDDAVVRLAITTAGFTIDAEAVNVDDTSLAANEYTGVGYSQHVCASVTWAWDATDDEMRLDFDDDPEAFGTTVAASDPAPNGAMYILQVGGSPSDANDYVIGWEDSGAYGNGSGLALGVTVPEGGALFSGQAAA